MSTIAERSFLLSVALLTVLFAPQMFSQVPPYPEYELPATPTGLGTEVTPEYYAAWDIDIPPSGAGLPEGSGTGLEGAKIFAVHCAGCHPTSGDHDGQGFPVLALGSLSEDKPQKWVDNYWPYATTVFDYVHRAMPFPKPQSLTSDELYALTAYILANSEIIDIEERLDAQTLAAVEMPNRHGFLTPDPRPDTHNTACMNDCPVLVSDPSASPSASTGASVDRGVGGAATTVAARPSSPAERPHGTFRGQTPQDPHSRGRHHPPVALPFAVQLVRADVGLPADEKKGLHSYSAAIAQEGEYRGSWLLLGGRTNGLHQTSGPSFPEYFANRRIWAIHPETRKVASVPLAGLPPFVQDALASSDQQYSKDYHRKLLWITGGYGWSSKHQQYGTFGLLIAVQVEALVEAVFAHDGEAVPDLASYFSWGMPEEACEFFGAPSEDASCGPCCDPEGSRAFDLVVTGGGMEFMNGDLVLALGQRFGGEYNRKLGNHQQFYTCRVLRIPPPGPVWGQNLTVRGIEILGEGGENCSPGDSGNAEDPFHRRDLNIVPIIRPKLGGNVQGVAVYGGVFTSNFSGFAEPMLVDAEGVDLFSAEQAAQSFCQYEAATVEFFDAKSQSMHSLILGGMGVNYCVFGEGGTNTPQCVQTDSIVPPAFVEGGTILSWNAAGEFSEALLYRPFAVHNPDLEEVLLGTNAHFLKSPGIKTYGNGVIQLDQLPRDRFTTVGHLFGGLATEGPAPRNVFFSDGPSWASALAFEVQVKPLQ